jgi:3'-phosphoadenosine 5'-phosphosulfate sulfotransferase (PAPS reductase)/FAD synthetase
MLIVTDRHTPADLGLWKDYEEYDALTPYSGRKAEESRRIISDWLSGHTDAAIYTSWGKDSVVLLDLAYQVRASCPVVYVYTEGENPDCRLVEQAFLSSHPDVNYYPVFFHHTGHDLQRHELIDMFGNHRITGIRNDESGVRTMIFKMYRFSSEHSCRPLALWTGAEVFAYIHHNRLPLCPAYGYLGGGRWKRERIRTHSLGGKSGDGFGRTEWEREYYPDILAKISAGYITRSCH